eukprot:scaffold3481_cov115-Cylindrotheca_fusiformis.AAC.6
MKKENTKKRVSFASTQTLFFSAQYLTKEERKNLCWFQNEDLESSRNEVREAIQLMQEMEGNMDAVHQSHGNICLRGVEKYADAEGKFRNQRLFIESVLRQYYHSKSDTEGLAAIARYMSQPSTTVALISASNCAADLKRMLEEEEEDKSSDVASTSSCIEVTCSKLETDPSAPNNSNKRLRPPCLDEITVHASRKIRCE